MVNACLKADSDIFTRVYSHWFPANQQAAVKSVLGGMVNPASTDGTGSTTLSKITIDNDDPYGICAQTVAYTINSAPGDGANDPIALTMHFCHTDNTNAYALPALSGVTCGDLDKFLSVKMQTLGGYALVHELSHVADISNAAIAALKIPIPMQPSSTCGNAEDFKYGPQSCQQLVTNKATSNDAVANADSYGWFVTVRIRFFQSTFSK